MFNQLFVMNPQPMRRSGAGIAAGALGGFIAGFVKLGWEVPFPPRAPGRIPEPQVLVSIFTHHPTSNAVSLIIHFAFSTVFGAFYGGVVEFFPLAAIGMGTVYGLAVWVGAHELVMPWIGLTPPALSLPWKEQCSELFGHAIWSFSIEIFRIVFRARFSAPLADYRQSPQTVSIDVHT